MHALPHGKRHLRAFPMGIRSGVETIDLQESVRSFSHSQWPFFANLQAMRCVDALCLWQMTKIGERDSPQFELFAQLRASRAQS
jgi:hypothetical protein